MAQAAFQSVPEMFLHRVASTPDTEAFEHPDPTQPSGWRQLDWRQVGERVRAVACGLRAFGVQPEQRCAILAGTRIDWLMADLGILCAGATTTTIYPSNTPDECAFILKDSSTVVVFAENDAQVAKLVAKRSELPDVKLVVTIDGKAGHDGWVTTMADLEANGREADKADPEAYERVAKSVRSDSLATLIYTSGTTGAPKGVELTHDCWVYEGEAMDNMGLLSPADKQYLFLPLAHSFAKVLEVAIIRIGIPTAVDGRQETLVDNLAVVKPTFMGAVPRIFEKVYNKAVGGAKEAGGLKYKIFTWAIGVGSEVSKLRQQGQEPSGWLAFKNSLADKLVFSKLKAKFGGRLRFFISGGAPLSRDIAQFFHASDVLILEGYGLTESSAASFVNRPEKYRFGTVGQPVPGTQVRIAQEDGEILIKSRGVMRGYHGLGEATAEMLDKDGWLHTGDIGEIDADGFLKITDRKKDLIKTSGGKYVAPQALENKLKAICPYVSQVVVHGNNRNFCTALVTLSEEEVKKWAAQNGADGRSYADLARDERVRALIQPYLDQLNGGLASYESIKTFALLPEDLTQENGALTPTLKVKRKVVETRYKDVLDGFYKGAMAAM